MASEPFEPETSASMITLHRSGRYGLQQRLWRKSPLLRVVAVECRAPPDVYDHPNFQGEHEPRDERRATYPSPRPRIEFDGEEPCDQGRQKDSGIDVLKKVD